MNEQVFNPHKHSEKAVATLSELDHRVERVFSEVKNTHIWKCIIDPETPEPSLKACIREIFLSVCWYQKHTTEAGIHMIGRLPKNENALLKSLMLHKIEEAEHGIWALQDYEDLGGDMDMAARPCSPATFAVTGVWWRMAFAENPFGYLGAEYLFEYLTAKVTPPVVELFNHRGIRWKGTRFIVEHATEDVKHTNLLRHLIGDSVTKYPDSAEAMFACFEYFKQVYPIAVWSEAYERAVPHPAD